MKKVVALLFTIAIGSSCFSQVISSQENEILFGFSLGTNYSNIIIPESPIPNGGKLKNGAGFQLGILMEAPLSERVSIVPRAELNFRGGQINFDNDPDGLQTIHVMSTTIDAIVHFNFKVTRNKLSPYIVLGPNFSYELTPDNSTSTQFTSIPNLSIDMGLGFNKALEYFGIAPEFRYSFGLFNVNGNPLMSTIYAHSITLALNFKG
jgi:hypothetical protein